LGSLITDGNTSLDNTTEYKVTFTPTRVISNTLGLMGIGATDAVNKDGKTLKIKIN
jgi:ADP-dependent phosphofructokinase/glucokinase